MENKSTTRKRLSNWVVFAAFGTVAVIIVAACSLAGGWLVGLLVPSVIVTLIAFALACRVVYAADHRELWQRNRMRWKQLVLVSALGVATWWLVWHWSLPPGFWGGSMLSGVDETNEQIARRYFGPLLLQKTFLYGKYNPDAFRMWGTFETTYRLVAIIIAQFCLVSTLLLLRQKRSNDRQPTAAASPSVDRQEVDGQ